MAMVASSGTNDSIQNMVIIGSGPAGYTAAIYAARANLSPLLITGFQRGGMPGGQLMTTTQVENFPGFPDGILGPDLMDRMKAQAERWGTRLVEADADRLDLQQRPFLVEADGDVFRTHSLILALGARANRLGIATEARFWAKGISACAICDGATPQFRGQPLAVVGGGDSACEEAAYLTRYSSEVHLVVRRHELRASRAMVDRVLANPGITVHWNRQLVACHGEAWLESITLQHSQDPEQREKLSVQGVFYAIGHTPNTELLKGQLGLDDGGYVELPCPGAPNTTIEGVYAAGDVADRRWRQAITAGGSGCQAALAAERWLTESNLARLMARSQPEPAAAVLPQQQEAATAASFDPAAAWQKGSYSLRRLYHESDKPLLVVYTSPGCGPCHVLKPQLRRVIQELDGQVMGVEIDIEVEQEIAQQAGVRGTPTTQLFWRKALVQQWQGVRQRSEFHRSIANLLDHGT